MKKIVYFILGLFILFSLFVGQVNFVEAGKGVKVKNNTTSTSYRILEGEEPKLLPTSPLYFLKEWGRGMRKFFTFNPVKKAELELKYADEKLAEFSKVVDENCGESKDSQNLQCNKEVLQKAFNNYLKSQQRLAKRLSSLDEKNPDIEKLLNKVGERVILHQALFDEISNRLGEIADLMKAKHDVAKNAIQNIRRVGYDFQNIEQVVNKLPYREGVKGLKALEILTRIEENLPEEAKEGVETAKEAIRRRLIETGEIQKAKDWKVEQGSSGWVLIEGVPVETKIFKRVIEKIEEEAKEVSPVSQRPNIVNLEAVKELKTRVQEATGVVDENAGGFGGGACPTIAPDTSKGKEECLKAAKHLDEIYPGCNYAEICEELSAQKPPLGCGSVPIAPGNWRCVEGVWQDISRCGKIRCLRYDPVCGENGRTYACGEVDALSCGVGVAYRGECRGGQHLGTPPFPGEQPATSTEDVSATKLP